MSSRKKLVQLIFLIIILLSCENKQQANKLTFIKIGGSKAYPSDGGPAKIDLLGSIKFEPYVDDFSVRFIPASTYRFTLQQMLLDDSAPMAFPILKEQLSQISQSGLLLDLKPYMSFMPNYMSLANKQHLDGFTIDGKIYGLPGLTMEGDFNGSNDDGWAIRKDWLNNLSYELPHNLTELENVLKGFTYDDPDMNGLNDTIGLSIDHACSILWGAFGLPYMNNNSLVERNGESRHISTLPEAKEILILLRHWYELGYINFDRFYNDGKTLLSSNSTGICMISVWSLNNVRYQMNKKGFPNAVQMLPAIEGPYGNKGYPINTIPSQALALNSSMTKSEIISMVQFLDWMVDTTETGGFMKTTYGKEGIHFQISDDKKNIHVINYNKQISDGYSNPIRFIPIIDRRWIAPGPLLDDLRTLNQKDDLIYCESQVQTTNEILYYTDFIWPKLFVGIITGETEIEEWEKYAKALNSYMK